MSGKVSVVAKREFLTTIKRKAYVITTLGMPLFILLYAGIAMIPALVIAKKTAQTRTIGIVDHSGLLGLDEETEFSKPAPPELEEIGQLDVSSSKGVVTIGKTFEDATKIKMRPYPNTAAAETAFRANEIASFYEFPEDYLKTGKVKAYSKGGLLGGLDSASKRSLLPVFIVEKLLAGKLDPVLMARVRNPMFVTKLALQKDGTFQKENWLGQIATLAVPGIFTMLFFLSVMMCSGFLLQGVSEEKENRVIEVILSSIDSDGLLLGKLIGLGGAGLLQVGIWAGMMLVLSPLLVPLLSLPGGIPLRVGSILISFVFYLLGFFLFGVLLTGTGSLGQNLKESQQLGIVWSLGSVVPIMFFMLLIDQPNGVFARVLSFIPLTAPVTMFLRLNSSEPPPIWEVALVGVVLAAAGWGALKVMGKIFRVGLLLYGKRPTLPEIIRLIRRPAA